MRVTLNGAACSVTGSAHLVESGGRRILLDCGLHQGRRSESDALNRSPGFDPSSIDLLILSHAHIDHSGLIPAVVRDGFRGPILCTAATRDLCALMLADSARIQESDADWLAREHPDSPPPVPLYTPADAARAMGSFHTVPYGRTVEPLPGFRVRLLDAGHILGSSQIELRDPDGATLLFSGDLGRPMPILRDPATGVSEPDAVLMEGTYGGKLHEPGEDSASGLADLVRRTARRGGRVLVPAFSVGRTQEILYTLRRLLGEGAIPGIPVFVDSPMAADATTIYRMHPECFDEEAMEIVYGGGSPFLFDGLRFTRTTAESRELNDLAGPSIVISASGMCEHGRILHHLKRTVVDPAGSVAIVGFMAEHTLGRALAEGARRIRIFGREYARQAEVAVFPGFSAHADTRGLEAWASALPGAEIVLVHGERDRLEALAGALRGTGREVRIPERGETLELAAGNRPGSAG
jgi:metallo-beta-lactamase family protein